MDTTTALAQLEAAVDTQLQIAGPDEALDAAASSLLQALRPALQAIALDLAEQAAIEVASQLDSHEVDVVVRSGEPSLVVRSLDEASSFASDDLKARLTVRLPQELKAELESAADDIGDSVNAYVIKTLASKSRRRSGGQSKRVTGTVET